MDDLICVCNVTKRYSKIKTAEQFTCILNNYIKYALRRNLINETVVKQLLKYEFTNELLLNYGLETKISNVEFTIQLHSKVFANKLIESTKYIAGTELINFINKHVILDNDKTVELAKSKTFLKQFTGGY